ncbi:MAG: TRAP transporter small permease subunit [Paracoccus denitrificans]|uniref:TRAP transporter small permease protein n=1 Tax=Paracoccus denitrificans TaxID=266 RepID=A0A533IE50_PARDE|nr:MAG: TRAP transporter small permease subunit [Paracoccus denitrificans]
MKRLLELLCVLLLLVLILVPFAQVVMRDLFGRPIIGAEELTRFLLICCVFVAYPLVVASGENIVMSEIQDSLPQRLRRIVIRVIAVCSIIACAFVAVVVAFNISDNLRNATPTLKIPFWLFLGATLFGFAGAAILHLFHLRKPPGPKIDVVS